MDSAVYATGSEAEMLAAMEGLTSTMSLFSFIIGILMVVANWMLFAKAGEAGWKSLIPFYNAYIQFKIVYGNGWKFLLCLIPIVGSIVSLVFYVRMAQVYGKGIGFGILNILFTPITMLIMAFGNAQYEGPVDSFI